jgi:hypothetical protein
MAAGAIALAASLVLGVGAARAISVSPLFFDGPSGFGFSPEAVAALPVSASADAESHWLLAGARSLLSGPGLVVSNHLSIVHSNPQGLGQTPDESNPLVADSTWTVTNETGAPLPGGYLVFTTIDLDHRYDGLRAGLDGALLEIVDYSFAGTEYAFGAVELPFLGVGQSVDLTVRYVVAGLLDYDAETNSYVLPRLGIAGLVVPEPAAIGAIGLGLAMLAARRRAGSHRSRASSR